ncbi:MAG: hypothetical protein U0736_26680 [Gemmataceae bacterium]
MADAQVNAPGGVEAAVLPTTAAPVLQVTVPLTPTPSVEVVDPARPDGPATPSIRRLTAEVESAHASRCSSTPSTRRGRPSQELGA